MPEVWSSWKRCNTHAHQVSPGGGGYKTGPRLFTWKVGKCKAHSLSPTMLSICLLVNWAMCFGEGFAVYDWGFAQIIYTRLEIHNTPSLYSPLTHTGSHSKRKSDPAVVTTGGLVGSPALDPVGASLWVTFPGMGLHLGRSWLTLRIINT